MSKYRIIQEQYPLMWGYIDGVDELPKDVTFTEPIILLQEKKSIFHKWKTIKQIDKILEAEYYVFNEKIKNTKTKKEIIKMI